VVGCEWGGGTLRRDFSRFVRKDSAAAPVHLLQLSSIPYNKSPLQVASIPWALEELRRVLRPGGKASILDFNNASASNPVVDAVQGWALQNVVVPTARSYGLEDEYRYLRPSIQAFPTGESSKSGPSAGYHLLKKQYRSFQPAHRTKQQRRGSSPPPPLHRRPKIKTTGLGIMPNLQQMQQCALRPMQLGQEGGQVVSLAQEYGQVVSLQSIGAWGGPYCGCPPPLPNAQCFLFTSYSFCHNCIFQEGEGGDACSVYQTTDGIKIGMIGKENQR